VQRATAQRQSTRAKHTSLGSNRILALGSLLSLGLGLDPALRFCPFRQPFGRHCGHRSRHDGCLVVRFQRAPPDVQRAPSRVDGAAGRGRRRLAAGARGCPLDRICNGCCHSRLAGLRGGRRHRRHRHRLQRCRHWLWHWRWPPHAHLGQRGERWHRREGDERVQACSGGLDCDRGDHHQWEGIGDAARSRSSKGRGRGRSGGSRSRSKSRSRSRSSGRR